MGGMLITIEGIDGSGKSTLARALQIELERKRSIVLLREPGGVALAERVREIVKDPALRCDPRAEALLYAAARAQLVDERVRPLLKQGTWVLLDRFVDSSLAYQGVARGLGLDEVAAINHFATGGLPPTRTLLLRVDAVTARARLFGRLIAPDRLEQETDEFFGVIADAYDELAATDPKRFRVLDADNPPARVLALALAALADLDPRS